MPEGKHLYEFGPFRLDPAERSLLRDGKAVPLTPKAFELLVLLVENRGHLLKKEELIERVWPNTRASSDRDTTSRIQRFLVARYSSYPGNSSVARLHLSH